MLVDVVAGPDVDLPALLLLMLLLALLLLLLSPLPLRVPSFLVVVVATPLAVEMLELAAMRLSLGDVDVDGLSPSKSRNVDDDAVGSDDDGNDADDDDVGANVPTRSGTDVLA